MVVLRSIASRSACLTRPITAPVCFSTLADPLVCLPLEYPTLPVSHWSGVHGWTVTLFPEFRAGGLTGRGAPSTNIGAAILRFRSGVLAWETTYFSTFRSEILQSLGHLQVVMDFAKFDANDTNAHHYTTGRTTRDTLCDGKACEPGAALPLQRSKLQYHLCTHAIEVKHIPTYPPASLLLAFSLRTSFPSC